MIKKITFILTCSFFISLIATIAAFMIGGFVFGIEWAFTDIENNRFMLWLEQDSKHVAQLYYGCLLGSIPFSVYLSGDNNE